MFQNLIKNIKSEKIATQQNENESCSVAANEASRSLFVLIFLIKFTEFS